MKNLRIMLIGAGVLFMGTFSNAQFYAKYGSKHHKANNEFEWLTREGVKNGDLTRREVDKLWMEWEKIQYLKREAYQNGRVSKREQRRIFEEERDFHERLHAYMNNRERERYNYQSKRQNQSRHYRH